MKVAIFTNEFPPNIYGGAGVHVDYLTRELAKHMDVEVRCFGNQRTSGGRLSALGHPKTTDIACSDPRFMKALDAMERNLRMAANLKDADIVHCHTWYSHFAGIVAKQLYDIPMVVTTHSFEPSRPWKAEQLGGAYHLTSWIERTAMRECDGIIAVSNGMKEDAIRFFNVPPEKIVVIPNGIDLGEYRPVAETDALVKYGIAPDVPYVLFVGRITKQKGIIHLVEAIPHISKDAAVVLCAGAPDTPEMAAKMREAVAGARKRHGRVTWIEEMVPKKDVIELYSRAAVFCCPSIYEPFGIINLEAMACGTAVVASRVGGIPEIVVDGETGYLVKYEKADTNTGEPTDPAAFSMALAARINELIEDGDKRARFGMAGRKRAGEKFGWEAIARETMEYYQRLVR